MSRGPCMFGSRCYRRNPQHFLDYSHAHLEGLEDVSVTESLANSMDNRTDTLKEQVALLATLRREREARQRAREARDVEQEEGVPRDRSPCHPARDVDIPKCSSSPSPSSSLGLYHTKIKDSPSTHRDGQSLYLTRLLHPSLGCISRSLQINFMVEWDWLKMNYEQMSLQTKDLLIIHGEQNSDLNTMAMPPNVKVRMVKPKYPYGTHHTKLMLFEYEDESVRVVVHTANLIGSDWTNRVQGLWVSPKCPRLAAASELSLEGDSVTHFKRELLRYLKYYEISDLNVYIRAVEKCDFSQVKVALIASVPNAHKGTDLNLWGLNALRSVVKKHCSFPHSTTDESWPLVVQCSSIGSLGPTSESWFTTELASSFAFSNSERLEPKLVYPTKKNVLDSYDGILGGSCLPYSGRTHEKQLWLRSYMHEWKSDRLHRTRAMPHIKTYARVDSKGERAALFLLTSANLSKAAWGSMNKKKDSQLIMSYELGVLFLPKFFNKEFFQLNEELRLPYDWPLVPYDEDHQPWFIDYLRAAL